MTDLADIRHHVYASQWSTALAGALANAAEARSSVAIDYVRQHVATAPAVEAEVVPHADDADPPGGSGQGDCIRWRGVEPPVCDGKAVDTYVQTFGGFWRAGDGPAHSPNDRRFDFELVGDNVYGDLPKCMNGDGAGDGAGACYGVGDGDGGIDADWPF